MISLDARTAGSLAVMAVCGTLIAAEAIRCKIKMKKDKEVDMSLGNHIETGVLVKKLGTHSPWPRPVFLWGGKETDYWEVSYKEKGKDITKVVTYDTGRKEGMTVPVEIYKYTGYMDGHEIEGRVIHSWDTELCLVSMGILFIMMTLLILVKCDTTPLTNAKLNV